MVNDLRDLGPLRPVFRYCDYLFCDGVNPCIKTNCGVDERGKQQMWSETNAACVSMSDKVRDQLLKNSEKKLPGNVMYFKHLRL